MGREERRAFERARVAYTARVRRGDEQLEATVENLGGLGALLATADLEVPLEPGDAIVLNIALPDRDPVDVEGEILRVEQELTGGEVRRAFAVRFLSPID
ncbi:MAG: PilZ domain-containing protein [Planctomycetota bacterium]|nr:PilZ domain-containing protein [Planctomycetota bacterium]